jgi:serine/threonine-protein kinase
MVSKVILSDHFAGFRLLRPLGKPGGFGAVYEAERKGDRIALKIFHAELLDDVELERFHREVRGLVRVRHPNLVAYVDSGSNEHGGRRWHWIAMELLTGESLREEIEAADRPLPSARARQLAQQVALGLSALHEVNIVHRDIKPENVFVTDDGTVKLLDFGVARFLDYSSLTQDGRFVGTLRYASPEQLRGDAQAATDLHALGVLLFEMLTGRRPFHGDELAIYRAILDERPDPPSAFADHVPPDLDRLVCALLEKEPFDRPPTAASVAAALRPRLALAARHTREPYPRDRIPKLYLRVRHDVIDAARVALGGVQPDGFIVGVNDRHPLRDARRLGRALGVPLGADPALMRMAYPRWSRTKSLRELPYAPQGLAPHHPDDLRPLDTARKLARAVVDQQDQVGADFFFSAAFALQSLGDAWLTRLPTLLDASLAARDAYGKPMYALVAVSLEDLCTVDAQMTLANRLGGGEPDGYWVALDCLNATSSTAELVFGLRFGLLMQERGRECVLARATSVRRIAWALGLSTEIGLGRYDGFRISDLRGGPGPGYTPARFELPSLLTALAPDVALRVLASGAVAEVDCPCPSCREAGDDLQARVNAAATHNAWVICREREGLDGVAPDQRVAELEEQIAAGQRDARGLGRAHVLDGPIRHHAIWLEALAEARRAGLLEPGRLRRRASSA